MTSNKQIFKPTLTDSNSISLGIGTQLRIVEVLSNGTKRYVKLLKAFEDNLFFGLFDVEDVDFQIEIDNRSGERTVVYALKFANFTKALVSRKGLYTSHQTFETFGKHFHFLSQETSRGRLAIDRISAQNGVTHSDAEIFYSRIGFSFAVEKDPNEVVVQTPVNGVDQQFDSYRPKGLTINVFIRMNAKTILITIGNENNLEDLKALVEKREDIPPEQQRYNFCGKQLLDNNKTLKEHNIVSDSTLHLMMRLNGGGVEHKPNGRSEDRAEERVFESDERISERGVICFGRRSVQRFIPYKEFKVDNNYAIKPFSIELRMRSHFPNI